ncbi:MAG: DUF99 family protein, partial [Methanospirillum sp.]|nr:DUF99 family protein [Methanospirillum sp.]
RKDINAIMLNGCVIAWYNLIDPGLIAQKTGIPVICVSYEESEGLTGHIQHHFPGDMERLSAYEKLGKRIEVDLKTGLTHFARGYGCSDQEVRQVSRIFTRNGKIPEPLRVARLCARSLMQYTSAGSITGIPAED